MWTAARSAGNHDPKTPQIHTFGPGFIGVLGMGICGRSVDQMCVQLYESNQPSKYYNKIL